MRRLGAALVCAAVLFGGPAWGQEPPPAGPAVPAELELTMTLLPERARRRDVLELSRDARGAFRPSERAAAQSARGLEIASRAREQGRDFGAAISAAAEERREGAARGARPGAGVPVLPPGVGAPGAP